MKVLWAPWRMEYIKKAIKGEQGCFLCEKSREKRDAENYVVYRSKHAFAILNAYPYNNGHMLIAPYRHVPDFESLTQEEVLDIHSILVLSVKALKIAYNPDGFNIGVNIGRVAGAGLEEHIHVHIVPRWSGDTNFMPVLAETKVIAQHLRATYEELVEAFKLAEKEISEKRRR